MEWKIELFDDSRMPMLYSPLAWFHQANGLRVAGPKGLSQGPATDRVRVETLTPPVRKGESRGYQVHCVVAALGASSRDVTFSHFPFACVTQNIEGGKHVLTKEMALVLDHVRGLAGHAGRLRRPCRNRHHPVSVNHYRRPSPDLQCCPYQHGAV